MFIGCINYYRDMWPSRAHILKPLTDHSGLKKLAPIPWTPEMQTAFNMIRALMAADALAAYPDHNKRIDVNTDAHDIQLGACIKAAPLPIFPINCQNHSRIIWLWKKKGYPLSLHSMSFEVCFLVLTFMSLLIIKT
ncbi:LOW QUALITY PROTEIN: hypothetical protein ACHAW6_015058 [Cyclotella cf. meneghiniana]